MPQLKSNCQSRLGQVCTKKYARCAKETDRLKTSHGIVTRLFKPKKTVFFKCDSIFVNMFAPEH